MLFREQESEDMANVALGLRLSKSIGFSEGILVSKKARSEDI
jgi:hypothetical protein